MANRIKNQPFHGELSSADASLGALVTIYESGKFVTYDVDETCEFFVITDVFISSATGGLVALFCDMDSTPTTVGSGESIIVGTLGSNGTITRHFVTPYVCGKGGNLIIKAPSGQVNCQIQGFIKANPNSSTYVTYNPAEQG